MEGADELQHHAMENKEDRQPKIPYSALSNMSEDLTRRGWRLDDPETLPDGSVLITLLDSELTAYMTGDILLVKEMNIAGEGSNFFFHEVLKPALKLSTGTLIATLIWEGGDSISRIIVNDGEIKEEQIDL